jgi:hypothetical protein
MSSALIALLLPQQYYRRPTLARTGNSTMQGEYFSVCENSSLTL